MHRKKLAVLIADTVERDCYLDRRGVRELVGKRSDWEKEILGFLVDFLADCQWTTGMKRKKILCLSKIVIL